MAKVRIRAMWVALVVALGVSMLMFLSARAGGVYQEGDTPTNTATETMTVTPSVTPTETVVYGVSAGEMYGYFDEFSQLGSLFAVGLGVVLVGFLIALAGGALGRGGRLFALAGILVLGGCLLALPGRVIADTPTPTAYPSDGVACQVGASTVRYNLTGGMAIAGDSGTGGGGYVDDTHGGGGSDYVKLYAPGSGAIDIDLAQPVWVDATTGWNWIDVGIDGSTNKAVDVLADDGTVILHGYSTLFTWAPVHLGVSHDGWATHIHIYMQDWELWFYGVGINGLCHPSVTATPTPSPTVTPNVIFSNPTCVGRLPSPTPYATMDLLHTLTPSSTSTPSPTGTQDTPTPLLPSTVVFPTAVLHGSSMVERFFGGFGSWGLNPDGWQGVYTSTVSHSGDGSGSVFFPGGSSDGFQVWTSAEWGPPLHVSGWVRGHDGSLCVGLEGGLLEGATPTPSAPGQCMVVTGDTWEQFDFAALFREKITGLWWNGSGGSAYVDELSVYGPDVLPSGALYCGETQAPTMTSVDYQHLTLTPLVLPTGGTQSILDYTIDDGTMTPFPCLVLADDIQATDVAGTPYGFPGAQVCFQRYTVNHLRMGGMDLDFVLFVVFGGGGVLTIFYLFRWLRA